MMFRFETAKNLGGLLKTVLGILVNALFIACSSCSYAGAQAPSCAMLFQFLDTSESLHLREGYMNEVAKMDLRGSLTIKDFDGYLRDNLGDSFVDAVKGNTAEFVLIATGDGPQALKLATSEGYRLQELVEKRVGFHQIRRVIDPIGKPGFIIYRVNGHDREIHIQSFLKWIGLSGSKLRTIGENYNWTPKLEKFFQKLGPPPDLVVYGFAEAAFLGLLKSNLVSNTPFLLRAYNALKPNRAAMKDEQSDLQGRPVQVVTLKNGQRIWFFKNMYGGLAGDLMQALSNYGAKNFLALGTAGSLTTRLPVGTVYTPKFVGDGQGHFSKINVFEPLSNVPVTATYEKVDTNNDQTPAWLDKAIHRKVETIEVELGYIIRWAQANPQIRLSTAMVISDILVGENRKDMTEWGGDDLNPLRSLFVDFIVQRLNLESPKDLRLRDYRIEIFDGGGRP